MRAWVVVWLKAETPFSTPGGSAAAIDCWTLWQKAATTWDPDRDTARFKAWAHRETWSTFLLRGLARGLGRLIDAAGFCCGSCKN